MTLRGIYLSTTTTIYVNRDKRSKSTHEESIARKEATLAMQAFRQIENTILINLGPHYFSALREIAISNNKKNGTYTDAVIMLIDYYRKSQKDMQWRYDHPSYAIKND